jgi:hypothetical protein
VVPWNSDLNHYRIASDPPNLLPTSTEHPNAAQGDSLPLVVPSDSGIKQSASLPSAVPSDPREQKRNLEMALKSRELQFTESDAVKYAENPVVTFKISKDPREEVAGATPRHGTIHPRDVNASQNVWGGPSEPCTSPSSHTI